MARPKSKYQALPAYVIKVVREALELSIGCLWKDELTSHWDPSPLGEHSPLAAPYFLAKFLDAPLDTALPSPTPAERGRQLVRKLIEAAKTLCKGTPPTAKEIADPVQVHKKHQDWAVLYFYYFHRNPQKKAEGVAQDLHIPAATFYTHITRAVENFAVALFEHTAPLLRPEPISISPMVGRETLLAEALATLRIHGTVALAGSGGVGKTTFAANLANQWERENVLRYTIRPGLTDNLNSFLFTIAYFLRQRGHTQLWAQIVANQGLTHGTAQLRGLLRYDLEALKAKTPCVLWIDDLDLLVGDDPLTKPLLSMLETLQGQIAMLWVGQSPLPIEPATGLIQQLIGLSLPEVQTWLAQNDIAFSEAQAAQLHAFTEGNPFRLWLWQALAKDEENTRWTSALRAAQASSGNALFAQLWRLRLTPDQQTLLQHLAVFRHAIPQDIFPKDSVASLVARHLALEVGAGQVQLRADVRQWVLERTVPTEQVRFHFLAAMKYAERGEFTEAAYHYIASGEAEAAIGLWYSQRRLERNKGQAPLALTLFQTINPANLKTDKDRSLLALLLSELYRSANMLEEAEKVLVQNFEMPATHPASVYKEQLWAEYLAERGQLPQALEKYRYALELLANWVAKRQVFLHQKRGHILAVLQRKPDEAYAEAALAQAHVEKMWGQIADIKGDYPTALKHYEQELLWAEKSGDVAACAEAHTDLGIMALYSLGDLPSAYHHFEIALRLNREIGHRRRTLDVEVCLGAAYIIDQHYTEAREVLLRTTLTLQEMQLPNLLANSASNLAEACFYLGNLDEAEHYAKVALREEDETQEPYPVTVLAHVARARASYEEAEILYTKAIKASKAIKDWWAEGFAWRGLGENHQASGQLSKTREAYAQALACFKKIDAKGEIIKTQQLLDALPPE